jgi:hypothetical protein
MSLRDQLGDRGVPGQVCLTCTWLESQPDSTRVEWGELLRDESVETSRLYRLARRNGFSASQSAFRNHRVDHEMDA